MTIPAVRRMTRARQLASLTALAFFLVFMGLAQIAAQRGTILLDGQVASWLSGQPFRQFRRPMLWLSLLGSGWVLVPLTIVASVLLWRRRHRLALAVPALVAGAITLETVIKWIVARPRPHGTAYAFPSGHVFLAVVVVGIGLYLLWTEPIRRGWRWAGTVAGVAVIGGVALSRLSLGLHWFTDVVGGLTGGAAYLVAGLTWVSARTRRSES